MNLIKKISLLIFITALCSCVDYKINEAGKKKEKKYYASSGFALIYNDNHYIEKVVNKKIDNEKIRVMHNVLKPNTPVKIINPVNSKIIKTKIYRKANYPEIFNVVLNEKTAAILDLDYKNPYVELIEIKKNKTFVAKESNMFEEEKNVAEKAPVDEVKMDDITTNKNKTKKKIFENTNYMILINDFYYEDSAIDLRDELIKKTKLTNIFVKKINSNKYRLLAGPFKNFNALKTTYISLNNLGFEDLNIKKD